MSSLLLSLLLVPGAFVALTVLTRLAALLRPTETHNGVPRPPHMPHWVPFIGNALKMASGDGFIRKVVQTVGPVARITAMGETRTFVMSQGLISYVYKNSKNFDFFWFRKHMHSVIFGMDYGLAFASVWDEKIFTAHHRNMQPGAIEATIRRYGVELEKRFKAMLDENASRGADVDFFDSIWDVIYTASSKAWFGSSFPAAESAKRFKAFDQSFPILNLSSLPSVARKPAVQTVDAMLAFLEEWYGTVEHDMEARKEMAPALVGQIEVSQEEGFSKRDIASTMLAGLWALEANAPIMAIWTIVEILRHGRILPALRAEVDQAIEGLSPPTLSSLLSLTQPEIVSRLPKVNAAFQESLRLYTDTCSLRIVQQDCVLPPDLCGPAGKDMGIALVAGEQVVCIARKVHIDDKWGDDAEKWDILRWLDGSKPKGTMHPFGGGVSMCEGRHFSSAEILTLVATFVHLADVQVVDDSIQPDRTRVGLGAIPIKGNMRVKFSARASSVKA